VCDLPLDIRTPLVAVDVHAVGHAVDAVYELRPRAQSAGAQTGDDVLELRCARRGHARERDLRKVGGTVRRPRRVSRRPLGRGYPRALGLVLDLRRWAVEVAAGPRVDHPRAVVEHLSEHVTEALDGLLHHLGHARDRGWDVVGQRGAARADVRRASRDPGGLRHANPRLGFTLGDLRVCPGPHLRHPLLLLR
jgi:hypothetical protein